MEHKALQNTSSILLSPGDTLRGYGENDVEILVTRRDRTDFALQALRAFGSRQTGAVALLDDEAAGTLHDTLQWLGPFLGTEMRVIFNFRSADDCLENLHVRLSEKLHINLDHPRFTDRCNILSRDITDNLTLIKKVFNLASGFALTLVKQNLTRPEWHVDNIGECMSPCHDFVRFVRVAHADGPYLALNEPGRNVFATGSGNRHFDVHNYTRGDGAGLYTIKGSRIHSPPVPNDGKPRTIYTITPDDFSPTINYKMI